MNVRQVILCSAASTALVVLLAVTAKGANVNWDPADTGGAGGSGSANWDITSNFWWNGTTETFWNNGNTDTAIFDNATAPTTVTLTTGINAGALTFNSDNYTVTGNTLTLGGATPTITVTNAGTTAMVASALAGSNGLTMAGAGTLILSGTNTYTGGTTVSAGTLKVNATAALQGATSVASGATLQWNVADNATWSNAITGSGLLQIELNGGNSANALNTMATGLSGFTGTIELANNGSLSYNKFKSNGIAGASGATLLIDSGSQYYASSGNATYSAIELSGIGNGENRGAIRLDSGTLTATNGTTLLANATIGTNGGTLAGTISGTATAGNTQTLTLGTVNETGTGNFTGVIEDGTGGGTLALTVFAGTQNLSAASTYSGGTSVNGGTLNLSFSSTGAPATNILASGSALTLGGGTLKLTGKASTTNSQAFGTTRLNAGSSTVNLTAGSTNPLSVNLGTVTRNAGATINFVQPSGTVSAANGTSLAAGGTASTILRASNGAAYATVGGTDWAAMDATNTFVVGLSTISGYTAFGSTSSVALTGNADLTAATAGTYTLSAASSPTTIRNITVAGNTLALGSFNLLTGGILSSQNLTISGTGKLEAASAGGELVLNQSANTTTISAVIANNTSASSLTKTGAGTVTFANGTAETYTGTTYVSQGTLLLGGNTGSGSVSFATSDFVVGPGATLAVDDVGTFSKNVTGAGNFQVGGGGFIYNNSLSSSGNTYTGSTAFNYGTMTITSTGVINGTSAISVASSNNGQVANSGSVTTAALGGVTIGGGNSTSSGMWANNNGGQLTTSFLTLNSANGQGSGTAHGGAYTNAAGATTTVSSIVTVNGEGSATAGIASSAAGSILKVLGGTVSAGGIILVSSASTNTVSNQGGTFNQSAGTTNIAGALTLSANGGSGAVGAAGNDAAFILTGGSVTASSIAVNAGSLTVNGGSLNVGSGGITSSGTAAINLGAGTLGAAGSDWSSSSAMSLTDASTGASFNTTDSVDGMTARTITLNGVLSGTGALNTTGGGTLVLGGASTYSGTTNINSGTLRLASTASLANTSAINISSGANFDVTALASGFNLGAAQALGGYSVTGNVTSAGTINPGGTGTAGALAINGNLSLTGGTVNFDLANVTTVDLGDNDLVNVGNLALSGTTTISLNLLNSALANGTYTLFNYTGTVTGGASNFSLQGASQMRQVLTLATTGASDGSVTLTVTGSAANLIWAGDGSGNVWDMTTTANFLNGTTPDKFYNFDSVTFDDTGSNSPAVAITGTLQPSSVTVNNSAQPYTFSGMGSIAGLTALTKTGTNTLTITNANTYSGGTTLSAGQINLNNASAIGTGPLTIAGGNIDNTSGGPITLSTDNQQNWNSNFTFVGSNDLNLGAGAVVLSGNETVTVGGHTLTVGGPIIGSGFTLTKAGAGTMVLSGSESYGNTVISGGTLTLSGAGVLGSGLYTGTISIASGAAFNDTSSAAQTISGVISGAGSVTFAGPGAVTLLTATNTYSGGTTIGTTVNLGNNGNENVAGLGTGAVTIGAGGILWLQPGSTGSSFNIANAITLNGGTIRGEDGVQHLQGAISIGASGGTVQATWGAKDVYLDGLISGSGNLTLSHGTTGGTGATIHITNANNTYSGTVSVSGAGSGVTLDLDNPAALQFAAVNLNPGTAGTMVLTNTGGATIAGLTSTSGGTVKPNSTAGTYTLTINDSTDFTYAGVLANNSSGILALTKTGAGAQTLGGTNTYTGATTVNGGTLVVSGSISGSTTTVNSGGTLAGTGTTGTVLVNNGGFVTAGAAVGSIGTLHTGNLTLDGTYLLTLNSTANTTDDLSVAGSLTLSGATLNLNDIAPGSGSLNLTIAQFTGSLTGTFTGLPEGSLVDNGLYTIDYGQQFANTVTLVAVPEPGAIMSLLGGVGILLGWRRRRQRN